MLPPPTASLGFQDYRCIVVTCNKGTKNSIDAAAHDYSSLAGADRCTFDLETNAALTLLENKFLSCQPSTLKGWNNQNTVAVHTQHTVACKSGRLFTLKLLYVELAKQPSNPTIHQQLVM